VATARHARLDARHGLCWGEGCRGARRPRCVMSRWPPGVLCGRAARMNWVLVLGIITGCTPLYSDDTLITLAPTLLGP
jgi:hypothetical protein